MKLNGKEGGIARGSVLEGQGAGRNWWEESLTGRDREHGVGERGESKSIRQSEPVKWKSNFE